MKFHQRFTFAFRTFFYAVFKSCYDMEFYRAVRSSPPRRAFVYFAVFFAFLGVVEVIALSPAASSAVSEAKKIVSARVPDGAAFSIKNGEFSSTVAAPYNLGADDALFIIDPSVTGLSAPETFAEKIGVLVGRDAVFFRQSENEIRTYAFRGTPDFSVTKEDMQKWLDKYAAVLIAVILLFFLAVYVFVYPLSTALFALFGSALALLIGKIWKLRLRYSHWLAVSFHAVTLPTLIELVLHAFNVRIPYAFSFIFFMFIASVILDERARPVVK